MTEHKAIAITFAKWIKDNWKIEKGKYRHRGDFFKNTPRNKLPNEEHLWDMFIQQYRP